MKIENPELGGMIVGEAGDNIGRGNRTSIYFKDESAYYPTPKR
jgi:phage terminase large subunit